MHFIRIKQTSEETPVDLFICLEDISSFVEVENQLVIKMKAGRNYAIAKELKQSLMRAIVSAEGSVINLA